jgi:4-hydroxy-tetrahydrodipicolinate synthase
MQQAKYTSDELRATLSGGLIPALPVMFDREGRVAQRAHEEYVAFMSSQPIAGAAVWAHTGRGLLLDAEMARVVMQQWRQALPGKPLIAGAGARGKYSSPSEATRATLSMASAAAEYGADALLVYPPSWLKDHEQRDSLIIEHHKRLVEEAGLPLVLFFLYEAAGGLSYTTEVLDELLSLPKVVGIKMATLDSVMTYQDVARHIQARHPDKLLITGEDRFLGYSLRRGAQAALIGMAGVCTDLQAELLGAHFQHRAERFLELSDMVDQLAEVLFIQPMEGYIGRVLFALAKLGVIPIEAANDPWGPALTPADFENITNVLNTLNVQVG